MDKIKNKTYLRVELRSRLPYRQIDKGIDRHGYIDSTVDADSEYILLMACYIHLQLAQSEFETM